MDVNLTEIYDKLKNNLMIRKMLVCLTCALIVKYYSEIRFQTKCDDLLAILNEKLSVQCPRLMNSFFFLLIWYTLKRLFNV